jgi:hypothetical protein
LSKVHDQSTQLGRILNLVLRLAEDHPKHARPFAEFFEGLAVVSFEIVAIQLQQRIPAESLWDGGRFVEGRLRLLVGHLQEEQERQLLDVIAIGQAVVAEDIAVVPELLDQGGGVGHWSRGDAEARLSGNWSRTV